MDCHANPCEPEDANENDRPSIHLGEVWPSIDNMVGQGPPGQRGQSVHEEALMGEIEE